MGQTFNPPYNGDENMETGEVVFTDGTGKVVDLAEIEAYGATLEAAPQEAASTSAPASETAAISTGGTDGSQPSN